MDIEVATPSLGLPYATFTKKNIHKFPKQCLKGLKKGQDLSAVFKLAIPHSTLNQTSRKKMPLTDEEKYLSRQIPPTFALSYDKTRKFNITYELKVRVYHDVWNDNS